MNWDQIEGKWRQAKGAVKQKWGKLTDDDLAFIGGSKDKFVVRLQERYGLSKEQAQNQLDEWVSTVPIDFQGQQPSREHAHQSRN